MDDMLVELVEDWEAETGLDFYKLTESQQYALTDRLMEDYQCGMEFAADCLADR
jgi:hypothetical protein